MGAQGKAPAKEPVSNDVAMAEVFGTDSDEEMPAGCVPSAAAAPAAKTGGASSSAGGNVAVSSSRADLVGNREKEGKRGGKGVDGLQRMASQQRQRASKLPEDVRRALAAQARAPKLVMGFCVVVIGGSLMCA